ncbi:MAG: AAC(3) family N-acetyltransferase [Candidatus Accumulibacter sp.]|uniref:Aminoglycoside N(3)-acetyltransferase n=1 Tax=Candidatus Accumulibacter proximus TaxID=2954385 RepID=A0A935PW59_9PROT|nr:AAC(3) family N-acetyltransferase [Candidatus Accumulibacter proximus]
MSWLGRIKFRTCGLIVERFLSYDAPAFTCALSELGIRSGDVLMVHSSLHAHSGYRDRPIDMIDALKCTLGSTGLLVMPSMTYTDSSKAFLSRGVEMKVRHSASKMGLLTEVFRRGKDVKRSLSPTHPLAAWGDRAEMFLAGHEKTDRPFGPDSPFQRLLELDGKILCIDTIPDAVTFTHFLEDRIQDKLPFPLYERDHYTGKVVDGDGRLHSVPTRVLSDDSRRYRREDVLWDKATARGVIRRKKVGNTTLMVLLCRELEALVENMYANGESLFSCRDHEQELGQTPLGGSASD